MDKLLTPPVGAFPFNGAVYAVYAGRSVLPGAAAMITAHPSY
jgi:hypothetical protein